MERTTSRRWVLWSAVASLLLGIGGLSGPLMVEGHGVITLGPLLLNVLAFNWAHSFMHLVVLGLLGAAGPLALREPDGMMLVLEIATNGAVHILHAIFAVIGVAIILAERSRPMHTKTA